MGITTKQELENAAGRGIVHQRENTGRFWVIEGVDGAGKGAVIDNIYPFDNHPSVTYCREPAMSNIGAVIKKFLCRPVSPRAKMCLAIGMMLYHWESVVEPALDRGHLVICDRHYPSTIAYQLQETGGEYLSLLRTLIDDTLLAYIEPPQVILIDVPGEVARERITGRGKNPANVDWYTEKVEVAEQIRANYLSYAPVYGWYIVDGARPLDKVVENVRQIMFPTID